MNERCLLWMSFLCRDSYVPSLDEVTRLSKPDCLSGPTRYNETIVWFKSGLCFIHNCTTRLRDKATQDILGGLKRFPLGNESSSLLASGCCCITAALRQRRKLVKLMMIWSFVNTKIVGAQQPSHMWVQERSLSWPSNSSEVWNTSHCLKIAQKSRILIFHFWHFPPIFVKTKVTCLVTLFYRKLYVKLAKIDHSKCKHTSLCSHCWMRLFLWFPNTVHLCDYRQKNIEPYRNKWKKVRAFLAIDPSINLK